MYKNNTKITQKILKDREKCETKIFHDNDKRKGKKHVCIIEHTSLYSSIAALTMTVVTPPLWTLGRDAPVVVTVSGTGTVTVTVGAVVPVTAPLVILEGLAAMAVAAAVAVVFTD